MFGDTQIIPQQIFKKNSDLSFLVAASSVDGTVPLHSVLDFKDAGINYQRVKVGLADKGKSDLSSRLLYEGDPELSSDVMYWKGTDIGEFSAKEETARWVRVQTKNTLRPNERVILNEKYFSLKPKLLWRQTASFTIAAVDYQGRWFGRSVQAGMIKPSYQSKVSYRYLSGLFNSTVFRRYYLEMVREGGRVFPQVKLTKLKDLPVFIPDLDMSTKIETKVEKIESYGWKNTSLKDIEVRTALIQELDQIFFDIYQIDPDSRAEMYNQLHND